MTQHVDEAQTAVLPRPGPASRPGPGPESGLGSGAPSRSGGLGPARAWDRVHTGPLLVAILTVQAVLSLRLVWSNTAFLDEATYLFAGHVELTHWLHGTSAPAYATYFSGAPVIYPPLAALVTNAGGLVAARLLSMAFMLGATALLWSTTAKLFSRLAACLAAALYAVLGPTQFLGSFATYDAMALFLLSASVWCVVSARDRDDSTWLLVAGALLLALANATKYATGLFDPTVVALGALTIAGRRGLKAGLGRGGYLAASTLGLISGLLALGGSEYLTGILSTTVSRAAAGNPASVVLRDSAEWIGLVCAVSVLGVLVGLLDHDRAQAAILVILAGSGVLAPLNQARIHTLTSLSKHVDFGAWFAAAAAGYALAWLAQAPLRRRAAPPPGRGPGRRRTAQAARGGLAGLGAVAGLAIIATAGAVGYRQASSFFQEWPDSAKVTAQLRTITRAHPGHYLAEDYDVPAYYLERTVTWERWTNTWYLSYRPPGAARPLTGPAAFRAAVAHHYFTLIILDFGDTASMDDVITRQISRSHDYRVIAELPYWDKFGTGRFTVWAYTPPARPAPRPPRHAPHTRAGHHHGHR